MWKKAACLALAVSAGLAQFAGPAEAQGNARSRDGALETSQQAIGRQVGDYEFRDPSGRLVRLADFRGKPVVLNFIYTSCADVCPQTTDNLAAAADEAWRALGAGSFQVLTIGFDTRFDTPEAMRRFAGRRGLAQSDWTFLSGEFPHIAGLADDVGFVFYSSPKGFDHIAQTTVIDGDGRVYAQVYGESFPLPQLVEPLKNLAYGRHDAATVAGIIDRFNLFCTVYDAATGRYRFDYSIYLEIAVGLLALGPVGFLLMRLWRNRGRS